MTQQRSNSYEQLQQALDRYLPTEQVTTHMVINGQVAVGGQPGMTAAELQQELADLAQGAETFDVLVSTLLDDENMAIVALNGPAERLADLAAFMDVTRAANAR